MAILTLIRFGITEKNIYILNRSRKEKLIMAKQEDNSMGDMMGMMVPMLGMVMMVSLIQPLSSSEEANGDITGYQCPYCGQVFDSYEDMVAHVESEHSGERIPIDISW